MTPERQLRRDVVLVLVIPCALIVGSLIKLWVEAAK